LQEATKLACLRNCLEVFGREHIVVFGDQLDDETAQAVADSAVNLVAVDEGSGGGNFRRAAEAAMQLAEEDLVYLVEDDFLHRAEAPAAIKDGLSLGVEYVTLYDHPDKYVDARQGGNPRVKRGGENTRLLCGEMTHWKVTNSTVMTFATTAGQLRKDWKIFLKYCGGRYTDDYRLFRALAWRGRRLISAVPGLATHCEARWLSPFYDWASLAIDCPPGSTS